MDTDRHGFLRDKSNVDIYFYPAFYLCESVFICG